MTNESKDTRIMHSDYGNIDAGLIRAVSVYYTFALYPLCDYMFA